MQMTATEKKLPASGSPANEKKPKFIGTLKARNLLTAWLFVLPGIAGTLVLRYYTIIQSFWISLHDYSIAQPPGPFVGFENYITMIKDPDFAMAWKNTLVFTLLNFLLCFLIPIIQALFLSQIRKGRGILSTLYLIPAVVPLSVNVILWKWIFDPNNGLANYLMKLMHLPAQTWFSNPHLTKLCIVIPGMIGGGVGVLLYLAAILGISPDIYEAAEIDGCTGWSKIIHITLPNIGFLIFIQMVLTLIGSLQILNQPLMFTNGGPNGASTTVGFLIYDYMSNRYLYGDATAIAFIMLIVIGVLTFVQLKLDRSERE